MSTFPPIQWEGRLVFIVNVEAKLTFFSGFLYFFERSCWTRLSCSHDIWLSFASLLDETPRELV